MSLDAFLKVFRMLLNETQTQETKQNISCEFNQQKKMSFQFITREIWDCSQATCDIYQSSHETDLLTGGKLCRKR
ncbi:CLUMA_CG018408, isoform A [Clunio marinus]|uniref:CLUMA_CG018408, isoform A n=1 Tax=Clunio marinus TaxID=568069 RepID=A0A1J1IY34_9DIPT|nr:CLUMA_CG018408, isoform A [Clunio marinus]